MILGVWLNCEMADSYAFLFVLLIIIIIILSIDFVKLKCPFFSDSWGDPFPTADPDWDLVIASDILLCELLVNIASAIYVICLKKGRYTNELMV